jgi:uncharacterized protein (TIGR02246 family)
MIRLFVLFAVFLCASLSHADQKQDEADVRAVVASRQQDAWNKHDAKAYANLFTNDGQVVNVLGWHWKGKAEIEQKLNAAFAYVFRESTLNITDVDVRFPADNVAFAYARWTMNGAKSPTGNPAQIPRQGIQLLVLEKKTGMWLITAFQNTNSVPEFPMPTGPSANR